MADSPRRNSLLYIRHALTTTPEAGCRWALLRKRWLSYRSGATQAISYGESIRLKDVTVTFHPAGHVLGSAQIAVTGGRTCIVASGDYKDAPDSTCAPFEIVPCDVFITEATFGLPIFRHGEADGEIRKLLDSVVLF